MNKVAVSGVAAVLVLGAGYLGATAWSGTQARSRYHDQIARAQARLPFLRVSEEQYQKGFFTSTSTTTLQFGCATAADPQAATATVTSTIHHGPLAAGTLAGAVIDSQLRIAGAQIQPVVDAFGGVPLTIRTVVGFTGSAHSTFDSPAAKLPIGTGGEVAWQGLTGTLDTGKDARAASYRFRSPGLTITDPTTHATVRLAGLALEGDGKATNDTGLITVGKMQGTLDSMEIGAGGADDSAKLVLSALKLNSNTWLDGDLLAGTGTFSGSGSFGDTKIDHFDMQTSMQRWHAPTYQHLMETATKEIYRCDSQDKMADLLGLQEKMKGDLVAMLRYEPELSLDKLAVQSGGLSGEISYSIGVDGVTEADAGLPAVALLMAHGRAQAAARFPVEWLRKMTTMGTARLQGKAADPAMFDMMLAQAQAQGYVVRDSDYVKTKVELANGVMKVNGKPLGPGAGGPGAGAGRMPGPSVRRP